MFDNNAFEAGFQHFCSLIHTKSGHEFVSFDEGLAAVWESYKPRLRKHALELLAIDSWNSGQVGSGAILASTIAAIEINNTTKNLINNLVFWDNRYGHSTRAHKVFLEAKNDANLCTQIETALFGLYKNTLDESVVFECLNDFTDGKYPLLAYLFFLKDSERFMPILPSTYDTAFQELGIDLVTKRNCSWKNYTQFNRELGNVQDALRSKPELHDASLLDAHSFCWLLIRLEEEVSTVDAYTNIDHGRIFGAREKSIWEMKSNTLNTVKNSNGQTESRIIKNKELRMTEQQLDKHLLQLIDMQENRCALTGLKFKYLGDATDSQLYPSLDRKDSSGHYEKGNLQVVCRFINFWKGDMDDGEFQRLIKLVRGIEE